MLYIFKVDRTFTPEDMKKTRQELLGQITEGLILLQSNISFVGIAPEAGGNVRGVALTDKDAAQQSAPDTVEKWIAQELSVEKYNLFIKDLIAENDHSHPTYEEWRRELEPDARAEAEEMKTKGALV